MSKNIDISHYGEFEENPHEEAEPSIHIWYKEKIQEMQNKTPHFILVLVIIAVFSIVIGIGISRYSYSTGVAIQDQYEIINSQKALIKKNDTEKDTITKTYNDRIKVLNTENQEAVKKGREARKILKDTYGITYENLPTKK